VETLRYSRNKLVLRIIGAVAMCAAGIYLFSNPDFADELPFPWDSFGGDLGHYAVSPIAVVTSAVFGWLAASRLISGRSAVECLADEIRVTTFWGRTRIKWADLGHVYLVKKRRQWVWTQHFLVFHYAGAGIFGAKRVRLPLDATELHRNRYEEFRLSILAHKRMPISSAAARPMVAAAEGDFDPDAALARYLARKAEAQPVPEPAPPPRATPARPVFGRKAS
jgi:hypothetical protein